MIPLSKRLRHRVTILKPLAQKDRVGGSSVTWSEFCAGLHAEVGAWTGKQVRLTNKGGEEDIVTTAIRIRYLPGITSSMRVSYGEQVFSIDDVDNERQANRTLLLTCHSIPFGAV